MRGCLHQGTKVCSHSCENRMRSNDESKFTLIGENMGTSIGENSSIAVVVSGSTKTACWDPWLRFNPDLH